jgi:hypothetical protein
MRIEALKEEEMEEESGRGSGMTGYISVMIDKSVIKVDLSSYTELVLSCFLFLVTCYCYCYFC